MKFADFEESEYRGPLYNQLEWGNHFIWEPGQVFEKHIGIDRAAFCTYEYLWELHGYNSPLGGVLMHRRRLDFIWSERKKKKELPDFKLNLFLQAKRPVVLSRGNKKLRNNGIKAGCWKFEVTDHQQVALEKLENKLEGDALVCYAAPAFHKQKDLYKHTTSKTIVEHSTFPSISELRGHSAWYYDSPGASGCANPIYKKIDGQSLEHRIARLFERNGDFDETSSNSRENLSRLAQAIYETMQETKSEFESARLSEAILNILRYIDEWDLEEDARYVKDYLLVREFCSIFKLQWFIVGAPNKKIQRTRYA